jgi:transposase
MKKLIIQDAGSIILGLQDEIRRSAEARYDHRLHGLLLVAQGMSGHEVARLLGDSPRTVAYWVSRFEEEGLAGLVDAERSGRPRRLSENQIQIIDAALRQQPERLFRQLGFRLRKPRPLIASADPEQQGRVKKTPAHGEQR